MPRTTFTWICREETTLEALQQLVKDLETYGGVRYATVKLLMVSEDHGVEVLPGARDLDGQPLEPLMFTLDNLPARGVVMLSPEEED